MKQKTSTQLPLESSVEKSVDQAQVQPSSGLQGEMVNSVAGQKLCSVQGCNRNHNAKGFCQKHYSRVKLHGTTDKPKPYDKRGSKNPKWRGFYKCSYPDCERGHRSLGYCDLHYKRFKKYGTPELPLVRKLRKYDYGPDNPAWKGGTITKKGRVMIHVPDHPNPSFASYVARARLVMEQHIGRFLSDDEVVHHKNRDTLDDGIDNLQLMTRVEHNTYHANDLKRIGKWARNHDECIACGSKTLKHKGNGMCSRCVDRKRYPSRRARIKERISNAI